ncbi:hypothetical protein D3C76_993960 [compost metagenome]
MQSHKQILGLRVAEYVSECPTVSEYLQLHAGFYPLPFLSAKWQTQDDIIHLQLGFIVVQAHDGACQRLATACCRRVQEFHLVAANAGEACLMVNCVKDPSAIKDFRLDDVILKASR